MRVRFAASLAVFALAGCGVLGGGAEKPGVLAPDDLAVMVVPHDELGTGVEALEVDTEDSGPISAGKAAEDTIDPKDTAKSLRRAGWTAGYELNYSDPKRAGAFARRQGLIAAGSSVEAFETDSAARERLVKEIRDYERFEGKMIQGAKLEEFDTFDAAVGDEAWGVHFVGRVGKVRVYATGVFFRHGDLLATAGFLRADATVERGAAIRLALALEERIEHRLAGELHEKPVCLCGDPKQLTLTADDFPLRMQSAHAGYFGVSGARAYLREYDVLGGRLGTSSVFYLRSGAVLYRNAKAAEKDQAYFASRRGRDSITRRYLRSFFRGEYELRNVVTRRLSIRRPDTGAFEFFFDAPRGRMAGVMVAVRVGERRGEVTVIGLARNLRSADVLAYADRVRIRLGG